MKAVTDNKAVVGNVSFAGTRILEETVGGGNVFADARVIDVRGEVMSPYKFTSKTHSLSTEDLGKFFIDSLIHSFIYLPTPRELFTLHRTVAVKSGKIARKSEKNN